MSGTNRIITLITDFGTADGYAGAMKGVILSINQSATIVDITHDIAPQDIPQAAYVLNRTYTYFPDDSIHIVVVDPGVGTDRRGIVVRTPAAFFIAPDNGVLTHVIGEQHEAINITSSEYLLEPVSSTFHGRDVFAPVAAHLSRGTAMDKFGDPASDLKTLPRPSPEPRQDGSLVGHVIHVDHFGNLITDVERGLLPRGKITIRVGGQAISGLSDTYARGTGLVALLGSDDHLEIGLKNGNAAAFLGAGYGDAVEIEPDLTA